MQMNPLIPAQSKNSLSARRHTFFDNTATDVRLLLIGEATPPLKPDPLSDASVRNHEIGERVWKDHPSRQLGPYDGLPDNLRK
jgi:hypothetical protein